MPSGEALDENDFVLERHAIKNVVNGNAGIDVGKRILSDCSADKPSDSKEDDSCADTSEGSHNEGNLVLINGFLILRLSATLIGRCGHFQRIGNEGRKSGGFGVRVEGKIKIQRKN